MGSFELYIFSFDLLSFDWSAVLGRILCVCELLLGAGLLSGLWRRTVNVLCAVLLGAFSAFLCWRVAVGDSGSCHCFGEVLDMNPSQSLVKNAVCAVLLAFAWKAPGEYWNAWSGKCRFLDWLISFRGRLTATLTAVILTVTMVAVFCPPDCWFRLVGHSSSDLSEEKWQPWSGEFGFNEGRQAVLFISPLCEFCGRCTDKMSAIIEKHSLPTDNIHAVFMQVTETPSDTEKLIGMFFEKHSAAADLDWRMMDYREFIPMTDGSMPLVCLFENGKLFKEYDLFSMEEAGIVSFLSNE